MNTEDLKFDKMPVDTKLAEVYLEQYKNEIENLITENADIIKLKTSDCVSFRDINEIYTHLSELIVERKQLFCQLEYLIRNIPIQETEEYDLKLLTNNLLFWSEHEVEESTNDQECIVQMDEDTPLVTLGWIAQIYVNCCFVPIINVTRKTAAICHLFFQLCKEAGLTIVLTCYEESKNVKKIKELENGCIGIITNRSDIDSAVDVLLDGPRRKPWAVSEILIEESAVERFKRSISWKTKNQPAVDANIASQCSESYTYNERLFLFEYVGDRLRENGAVLINTYRTVKELLSLVPVCLSVSLWSSDVAESNEIALKLNTTIVWVNGFGNFNGPEQTSQSLFSLFSANTKKFIKPSSGLQSILKLQNAWLKMDVLNRTAVVKKCLDLKIRWEDFVHVGNTYICFGVMLPVGLMSFRTDIIYEEDVGKNLIIGNAVIVNDVKNKDFQEQINKLREAGAPICCESFNYTDEGYESSIDEFYKRKVIWTSYGTIFAN